jgi:hypothetical protein
VCFTTRWVALEVEDGIGMPPFSEVTRVEAAIKNKSAKELEWSLWYCRMRQTAPSARPADVRYWSAMEAKVEAVLAPPAAEKQYPKKKKKAGRGLGADVAGVVGAGSSEAGAEER